MIDLHCHILPGIDDGAKDVSEAKAMVTAQRESGVDAMYLTPHFNPEQQTIEAFLEAREKAWELLSSVLDPKNLPEIRLGAEVRYCPELLSQDMRQVTLGQSDYLLLEMPARRYPAYVVQIMEKLLEMGYMPVLAHVERYDYFREEPELLKRLIDLGALAQISAGALFDKRDRGFAIACLEHGLAQLVSSDAHNMDTRKPNMNLFQKLPAELQQRHNVFAESIWENELPPYLRATKLKKTFFGYR